MDAIGREWLAKKHDDRGQDTSFTAIKHHANVTTAIVEVFLK